MTIANAHTHAHVNHPVVSRQQWLADRKKLMAREKELTRLGDQIARERRALPWVRIDKTYMVDHTDATTLHLAQRDVTFVAVSRAPLGEIERFRERMGWKFPWVSSHGTDFNRDFHVSFTADEMASGKADYNFGGTAPGEEMPGVSVFWKDDAGEVFHTYSTYGRGVEVMMHTYRLLDLTPKGRDEDELTYTMEWVRHHDRYELAPAAGSCCGG